MDVQGRLRVLIRADYQRWPVRRRPRADPVWLKSPDGSDIIDISSADADPES